MTTNAGTSVPESMNLTKYRFIRSSNMNSRYGKNIKSGVIFIGFILLGAILGGSVIPVRAQSSNEDKVKEVLQVMKDEAAKLGESRTEGSGLYFGTIRINGDYTIVDALKTRFSCTATFFKKKGTGFVRISTNVLNDGNRAVGTVLDPNGPAYAAISKGESFYGIVDILGKKYQSGYEPIKNKAGETIGTYYVGFLQE